MISLKDNGAPEMASFFMAEKLRQTTVKEQIVESLQKTNIRQEPEKYLDLLDNLEEIELRERQEERRKKVFGKLNG